MGFEGGRSWRAGGFQGWGLPELRATRVVAATLGARPSPVWRRRHLAAPCLFTRHHRPRPPPQVARTMAPSVILIDEAEKVFVADKKKAKEFGGQVRPGA